MSTASAVALTGALALGPAGAASAPAAAPKQVITNYGFNGWAYGTYAQVGLVGVKSAPTAYSYMGCTRRTGIQRDRSIAGANVPNPSPALKVGAVTSNSRSYRAWGRVGMLSTNKVASIRLGLPNGPHINITGLATTADAYAKNGKLGSRAVFTSADISAETGTPLDDILNPIGASIGDLLKELSKNAGYLEIPGLGRISLGRTVKRAYNPYAWANATALRAQLFGADMQKGTDDDIDVVIGRSYARISKKLPSAVMGGSAKVVEGKVLDGVATIGPVSERTIPCEGTGGNVRKDATVGANLLNANAVVAGVAQTRVFGKQLTKGRANAWTEASLADIKIGVGDSSLQIKGVVARANVRRTATGKFLRTTTGSRIASISLGGKTYPIPLPGQTLDLGVAKIQTMVRSTTKTSIKVTALRVTVLGEKTVVLNIGVAKANIRRS